MSATKFSTLFLLVLGASSVVASNENNINNMSSIIGVNPSNQHLYSPDFNGQWKCLNNPEILLNFSQINDNYCDCPDGSDEPGTSACSPLGEFYCANNGFKPKVIKSYLVNDGVCDYEVCCDGSDEWNIQCPDRCEEMRIREEERIEAKVKEITEGQLALKSVLNNVQLERTKFEDQLNEKNEELKIITKKLEKLISTPEYLKISEQREEEEKIIKILNEIQKDIEIKFETFIKSKDYHTSLLGILQNLKDTYNPNLNDATVKKTIQDFQYHMDLYKGEYDADFQDNPLKSWKKIKKILNSGFQNIVKNYSDLQNQCTTNLAKYQDLKKRSEQLEKILNYFINNYNPNFNDLNVKKAVKSFQDLSSRKNSKIINILIEYDFVDKLFQDSLEIIRYTEKVKTSFLYKDVAPYLTFQQKFQYFLIQKWNKFIGLEYISNPLPTNHIDEIKSQINNLKFLQNSLNDQISNLQLRENFGPNDILRIPRIIKSTISDYDYSIELTGNIIQSSRVTIGRFTSFQIKEISKFEQQLILSYNHGDKCWNGPIRTANVILKCGIEDEIVSVSELEKCQYEFVVRSPLGCKFVELKDLENIRELL